MNADRLWLLDLRVDYGLSSTEEQLTLIDRFARVYRPSLFILEADAQQKALGNDERLRDLASLRGFRIVPHLTRGEKADATFGVASMDQSFLRHEISIPWADDEAQRGLRNDHGSTQHCHQSRHTHSRRLERVQAVGDGGG